MGIRLPGISGHQALKILCEAPARKYIPVFAPCVNAMPCDFRNGAQIGFFHYLTQAVKLNELVAALELARVRSNGAVRPGFR